MFSKLVFICSTVLFCTGQGQIAPFPTPGLLPETQINSQPVEVGLETPDQTFNRLDTNKDDVIDLNDFYRRETYFSNLTENDFMKMDSDGDGNVTRQEYGSHYEKLEADWSKREIEWTNSTFQEFDSDHDNLLSLEEIRAYLKTRLNSDSDIIMVMIKPFDVDRNGQLDLMEFHDFEKDLPYHMTNPLPLPNMKR